MAMTVNGWTNSQSNGKNLYQKRRNFSDKSYCLVTISNVDTYPFSKPVIYSQGFVPAPYGKGYISRQVQVIATNPVTFSKAISAKGTITLGGQMTVDSFDSSSTNYSTGGKYDPAKHRANGGVVTNSKSNPAINVGNGHIYGIAETGPAGTIAANSGGTVGDFA